LLSSFFLLSDIKGIDAVVICNDDDFFVFLHVLQVRMDRAAYHYRAQRCADFHDGLSLVIDGAEFSSNGLPHFCLLDKFSQQGWKVKVVHGMENQALHFLSSTSSYIHITKNKIRQNYMEQSFTESSQLPTFTQTTKRVVRMLQLKFCIALFLHTSEVTPPLVARLKNSLQIFIYNWITQSSKLLNSLELQLSKK
jgi:hypothetical protein